MARPKGSFNRATEERAEELWDLLWKYDKVGITKRQACWELDISSAAFNSALHFLKLEFQAANAAPITCNPKSKRYVINPSETDARKYSEWIIKRLLGQTEGQRPLLSAIKAKFGDSRRTRRMIRYNEELVDTLEEMLEEVA